MDHAQGRAEASGPGLEGPAITGLVAVAMALVGGVAVVAHGASEEALREVVRWSARIGVVLFCAAFAARPLRQLRVARVTGWMLRNRRYLGLGFAVAHFSHLAALGGIALAYPDPFVSELDPVTLYGGGFAYLMLTAMTITSTDRTAAWLSRRNWRRLHTFGSWVIWIVFTASYLPRAAVEDVRYAPFAVLLLGVLGLRVGVRHARRASRPPAVEAGA